jgi:hypothetical protein
MAAGNASGLFPVIAPGPVPNLNSTLIAAGNASGLFPEIAPAPVPSPAGGTPPQEAAHGAGPAGRVADASTRALGTPVLTAQVMGLIALALAVMLTVTRLSVRRRPRTRGPRA